MSKPQQLLVTFAGGYIAGVFCATVSHPADTVVSKLNADVGSSALRVAKALGWRGSSTKRNCKGIFVGYATTLLFSISIVERPGS